MRYMKFIAALAMTASLGFNSIAQSKTTDRDAALAAGWKANFICSAYFTGGQSLAEIQENELSGIYPDFQDAFDELPKAEIDDAKKYVSVSYADNKRPRLSVWRQGFGCSDLPLGATLKNASTLPSFSNNLPINKDVGTVIGSDVVVDLYIEEKEALEVPLSVAFDGDTYGEGTQTSAVVIVRNGQIHAEKYARGIDANTPQRTWSVAKSITATIIGAGAMKGYVRLDGPAVIEAWNKEVDPRREITLRDLLRMSSGLDSGAVGSRTDDIHFGGGRVVDFATTRSLEVEPGTRFKYANNDTLIAMRSMRETINDDGIYHTFPFELLAKIGATHTSLETDWNGDFVSSSQVWATARDLARIGQLYVQDGRWAGEAILPAGWIDFVTTRGAAQPDGPFGYGAQFWLFDNFEGVPQDTFAAMGNRGQFIVMIPSRDVVIVRRGYDIIGGERFDIVAFTRDVVAAFDRADVEIAKALQARIDKEAADAAARAAEPVYARSRD